MKQGPILIAIGIGAFLGVVAVCGGLGAGVLLLMKWEMDRDWAHYNSYAVVEDVDYTLAGPETVAAGEIAIFKVNVTNTSQTEHRTLRSIALYTELADHSKVTFVPAPQWFDESTGGSYGHAMFDLPLPPGATQIIEVHFTPTRPRYYNVNIDVHVDTGFIERYHDLRVVVPESRD